MLDFPRIHILDFKYFLIKRFHITYFLNLGHILKGYKGFLVYYLSSPKPIMASRYKRNIKGVAKRPECKCF